MKIEASKRLAANLLDRFEKFAGGLKDGYQEIQGLECVLYADESSEDVIVLGLYDNSDATKMVQLLKRAGFTGSRKGSKFREDGHEMISVLVK